MNVLCAYSGAEALELIKESQKLTTCLIDINMPGMSGCELCDHIREHFRSQGREDLTPTLVAITAQENPDDHPDFRPGQFDDILIKPVLSKQILPYLE